MNTPLIANLLVLLNIGLPLLCYHFMAFQALVSSTNFSFDRWLGEDTRRLSREHMQWEMQVVRLTKIWEIVRNGCIAIVP